MTSQFGIVLRHEVNEAAKEAFFGRGGIEDKISCRFRFQRIRNEPQGAQWDWPDLQLHGPNGEDGHKCIASEDRDALHGLLVVRFECMSKRQIPFDVMEVTLQLKLRRQRPPCRRQCAYSRFPAEQLNSEHIAFADVAGFRSSVGKES